MKKIFEVTKKLECAYPVRGKVLEVANLDIYPGEIVVILGNSGAGKSTLIETLGLMTDTLKNDAQNEGNGEVKFYPNSSIDKPVIIPDVWKQGKNGEVVTHVRRENFNFIFQDNNLMMNLRNDENIILADLIDGGLTYEQSAERTKGTFRALNILPNVGENFPMNVSGGERQRLAFARGIQPEFKVLFGDEPTGNLDEENAENLLKYLQERIPRDSKDKAAIIVSHNIDLSLKFADRIIILTKAPQNGYYEILPEYVFRRHSRDKDIWQGEFPLNSKIIEKQPDRFPATHQDNLLKENLPLSELKKYRQNDIPALSDKRINSKDHEGYVNIRSLKNYIKYILQKNVKSSDVKYSSEEVHSSLAVKIMTWMGMMIMTLSKKLAAYFNSKKYLAKLNINEYFSHLLFKKECAQLAGKRDISIKFLSISIFVTFLIIGLANGQLNELRNELMKDPFTLTLDVLHRDGEMQKRTRELLVDILTNKDTMDYYNLDQITEYSRDYLTFYDFENRNRHKFYLGRSMEKTDPMIAKILDREINPSAFGRGFNKINDIGLIVVKDLLQALNYDPDSPAIFARVFDYESEKYLSVPIPIIAVVDQLPGRRKNYFLYTPSFFDYYADWDVFFPYKTHKNIKIVSRVSENMVDSLKNALKNGLDKLEDKKIPGYAGYRKIEIGKNPHYMDTLYEFVIYPRRNNRDLFQQKMLIDSLLNDRQFAAFLGDIGLKPGKDIFQQFYFDVPPASEETIDTDNEERANISFLFTDPSKIKEFASMFSHKTQKIAEEIGDKNKEGLLLDIQKVESMFIFSKVSTLTYSILFILIVIIVCANMQYISNLLNMHLYKIRRNIGTLMAFGINIKTIYHFLLLSFVLYCFVISFILANAVGYLLLDMTGVLTFSLYSGFSEIDVWMTILAVGLIFAGSYAVYYYAKYQYFSKTPSQLIYDRIGNDFWEEFRSIFFKKKTKNGG